MRFLILMIMATLSGTASAQQIRPKPSEVSAAIDRGLGFLAKDAMAWKNAHNCVSCHHAGLVIWAMRDAKEGGHAVDEPVLAELTKWVAESGDGKFGMARPASSPRPARPGRSIQRRYGLPLCCVPIPRRTRFRGERGQERGQAFHGRVRETGSVHRTLFRSMNTPTPRTPVTPASPRPGCDSSGCPIRRRDHAVNTPAGIQVEFAFQITWK